MAVKLKQSFYHQATPIVAQQLLGKVVVHQTAKGQRQVMITETEMYSGEKDLASHARFGPTKRNAAMYGKAGIWYVYLIYGMYYMLNVVTEQEQRPAAILLRAGVPYDANIKTLGAAASKGKKKITSTRLFGPGSLTKYLGITKHLNLTLVTGSQLFVVDQGIIVPNQEIQRLPRVGVDYAGAWKDKLWRFGWAKYVKK